MAIIDRMPMLQKALLYILVFTLCNIAVGVWGWMVIPITTSCCVAANMFLRDNVIHQYGAFWSISMVAIAGMVTAAVSPVATQAAIGCFVAVVASCGAANILYRFTDNIVIVNICTAAVDALIFSPVAFLEIMPGVMAMQFGVKCVAVVSIGVFIAKLERREAHNND